MSELYIFDMNDNPLTILSEDTGLVSAIVRDEHNSISDDPFVFEIKASSELARYVAEENKVVFKDHEGDLRIAVIKELDDAHTIQDGPITVATCEPEVLELYESFIMDRRFVDSQAQPALDAALEGTGWEGIVEVQLGLATTNFYRTSAIDAVWNVIETWGGEFKDVVELDSENYITKRRIRIMQRRGRDTGQRFEIDQNVKEIGRTVLSYPVSAMYGWGASLEIEDEDGEHTGGYSRYIDFGDVEWKKSAGDPVDKPKGQLWVGDPEAFEKYKRFRDGKWRHRYGEFSNQNYEDPEDLLWAAWEDLQARKNPEINYRLSLDLFDDADIQLGDSAIAIDRYFARAIEVQARIIALEYDLLDIENTMVVEMGQFLNIHDDRISDLENQIDDIRKRPSRPVTDDSFPSIIPRVPINVYAEGGFEVIQLYWDMDPAIYIKHYEVYGSEVADFVPDSGNLLWRGSVSGFAHNVGTDKTWYYYVRAVNYQGEASGFSEQASASTVRIMTDDIMFGEIVADHLQDNLDIADKLAQNTIDRINRGPQEQIEYTNEQINTVHRILAEDIGNLGVLILDYKETVDGVIDTMSRLSGDVDSLSLDVSRIERTSDSLEITVGNIQTDISEMDGRMEVISASIKLLPDVINLEISNNLDRFGIGNRNLFSYTSLAHIVVAHTSNIAQPISSKQIAFKRHGPQPSGLMYSYITFRNGGEVVGSSQEIRPEIEEIVLNVPDGANEIIYGVAGNFGAADSAIEAIKEMKIKIEEGNEHTAYSIAPEDQALHDPIAYINLSREGVRIGGKFTHISGQTLIDDAVIGTAAIKDAAITNAKIDRLAVDTAQINDAAITSAKIARLAVDTAHIANAAITNAKIANLNVDKLYGTLATFVRENFNGVTSQVQITGFGLETYSGGEMTSRVNGSGHRFYRDDMDIGYIGTNSWINDPYYRGLMFGLESDSDYMTWAYRRPGASTYTTMLSWHRSDRKTGFNGFDFSDHVMVSMGSNLYVDTFSTIGIKVVGGYEDRRHVRFVNFAFDGYNGVAFARGASGDGAKLHLTSNRAFLISGGNAYIEVTQDGTGNAVRSIDVYNRTYTSSSQMMRVTVNGVLGRSTSSRRYKLLEEAIHLSYAERLLELDAKSWFDKRAIEEYAHTIETGEETEGLEITRIGGLIAEDVHDVGLGMYVNYDDKGRPEGIHHNLWTLLIPVTKRVRDDVEDLKTDLQLVRNELKIVRSENVALKDKIKTLEEKIA